jgi:protein SPA2
VADIHVTAFLSAIDSLLTAAWSSSPVRVLTPTKGVVNAATAIVEDIRAYEARGDPDADASALLALRERAEATLGNLVAASRTHAMSAGMSPVSLVDAAASHVAATVTEVGRTLCIRKATKAAQEQFAAVSSGGVGSGSSTTNDLL